MDAFAASSGLKSSPSEERNAASAVVIYELSTDKSWLQLAQLLFPTRAPAGEEAACTAEEAKDELAAAAAEGVAAAVAPAPPEALALHADVRARTASGDARCSSARGRPPRGSSPAGKPPPLEADSSTPQRTPSPASLARPATARPAAASPPTGSVRPVPSAFDVLAAVGVDDGDSGAPSPRAPRRPPLSSHLRVPLPDTWLVHAGRVVAWLRTGADGRLVRERDGYTNVRTMRRALLSKPRHSEPRHHRFACVAHYRAFEAARTDDVRARRPVRLTRERRKELRGSDSLALTVSKRNRSPTP